MDRLTEIDRAATRRNPRALSSWERARHVVKILMRIDQRGPDDCWEWQAGCFKNGYGQIGGGGYAHRAMYELVIGRPLESHEHLMHSCDNPPCCNPLHLKIGSSHENNEDTHRKGRHPLSKLTAEQVRAIRRRLAAGESQRTVAADYGIHSGTMSQIASRKTYRWVT